MSILKTPHQFLVERELGKYAKSKVEKKILEVGSGKVSSRKFFTNCDFTATDVKNYPGIDEIADATKLQFKGNSFDIVLCLNVLEHVKDYQAAVDEIYRVLKQNGEVVVVVPFLFPLHDVPHDYWRFTEFSLREIFSKFKKVEVKPIVLSKVLWRFVLDYFVVAKK